MSLGQRRIKKPNISVEQLVEDVPLFFLLVSFSLSLQHMLLVVTAANGTQKEHEGHAHA